MSKLRNVHVLSISAMLTALAIVAIFFKVPIAPSIEVRFQALPIAVAGALFGPGIGASVAGVSDIVGVLIRPSGPFFPGFTISAMLTGMVYGLFLYKKPKSISRILLCQLLISLVINLLLNTYWLSLLIGKGYWALLPGRVIKEVMMFPILSILQYLIYKKVPFKRFEELS
ncbi:folate family ECF transporter S component [Granulicatella balaenopterae]|nr:folate family ECF transporter S component [Granulicatella balaenopterae]